VSLIYALGDEQTRAKVLAAHDRAVSAGILLADHVRSAL
jgi:hypothetical protein